MANWEFEFEWDLVKEIDNINKHNCTFIESVESFADPHGIQLLDVKHSDLETRFYWIGKTSSDRILTTWFTKRDRKIRIIGSAEWRKFRRLYETTKIE